MKGFFRSRAGILADPPPPGPVALGDAARARRDWPAAAAAYAEAVRQNPGDAGIAMQLGHALKEAGDLVAAERAYRAALALQPDIADTLLHLGHLVGRRGDRLEALQLLEQAARLAPDNAVLLEELSRQRLAAIEWLCDRAETEFDAGDHASALFSFRAALDTMPGTTGRLPALAARLAASGAAAAVEQAARGALARDAESPAANAIMARLLMQRGALGEAAERLSALLRQHPGDAPARAALKRLRLSLNQAAREVVAEEYGAEPEDLPASLDFVCFGTTGLCNASCIHCPTGKGATAHVPRTPMPMALFERIVRQMAAMHYTVRGQISLGLFGDGLVDPHVVERVALLRRLLPEATISVNTNGAAYNPQRHKALLPLVSQISVHVESLRPEVYDTLMAPLRAERVLPKVEALLRDFRGKVYVSIPVSRLNRDELPAMQRYFQDHGAMGVGLDGLSSRCAEDRSAFDRIALSPSKIACKPDQVSDNLIVDCDGLLLLCCNDFERIEPVGDLSRQSLVEALLSPARREMVAQMAQGRHHELATCRRCYGDVRHYRDALSAMPSA